MALLRIADRKPLLFSFLALVAWILVAGVLNVLFIYGLKLPQGNSIAMQSGSLVATLILLIIIARLGWLGRIGITKFGSFSTGLASLALIVVIVLIGWYSFFGEFSFTLYPFTSKSEITTILIGALLAGFVEETVFRGFILYSLIRVWGKTRMGIVASILVQAVLFGGLHSLQLISGVDTGAALANVLETVIFGILVGAVVVAGGTIWPAMLMHAASNAFILIKGIFSPWVDPVSLGYLREALLELPLVVLSMWIALRLRNGRSKVLPGEPMQSVDG